MENYETLVEKVIKEQIEDLQDDLRFKCLYDSKLVEDFCRKYEKNLVRIDFTTENTTPDAIIIEPMYYFDDNLGGYTGAGIINSLKEAEDSLIQQ